MHKFLFLLLTAYSLPLSALKMEMPSCVQDYVNNYVSDSTSEDGFIYMKKALGELMDQSIKSNEIEVDLPIKEYIFDYEKLDTCSDSLPIEDLIRPTGLWIIPIKAHGKYIYEILVRKTMDSCKVVGNRSLNYDLFWGDLKKKCPSSSGDNPVLVISGSSNYLHFPKRGSRNLYYLNPDNFSGRSATHDLSSKNDGRKIIASIKKSYKDKKPYIDGIKKTHPEVFKKMRNSGGEE
jgi:hypothetical protein